MKNINNNNINILNLKLSYYMKEQKDFLNVLLNV